MVRKVDLVGFNDSDSRTALTSEEFGILAVVDVEVLENGMIRSCCQCTVENGKMNFGHTSASGRSTKFAFGAFLLF